MDANQYFQRASDLLKREEASLMAFVTAALERRILEDSGEPVPTRLTPSALVARHQRIVDEMAKLGEEFVRDT